MKTYWVQFFEALVVIKTIMIKEREKNLFFTRGVANQNIKNWKILITQHWTVAVII